MIDWILRTRLLVLGLFVCALALAAYGAAHLKIDPNNRVFYSERQEHYANLLDLEARFGSNTSLFYLVVAESSLAESDQLAPAVRWLSDAVWRIDQVRSVESIATYPHVSGNENELIVENLLDYICPESHPCIKARFGELDKPHLINRLIGRDGNVFAVVADVDLRQPTSNEVTDIAREATQLQEEFRTTFPSLSLYLTGGVPMMQAFFDAAQQDSQNLMVIALVVLGIGLYLFLGGVLPMLLMVLLGVSAVLVALGMAGWLGHVVNTATATAPLIIFTLVVASAMHVFLHIAREEGMGSKEGQMKAVRVSVAANWRPVFLTTVTTVLGLLSMVFVSAPPLQQLAALAAVGVAVGAFLSLTVIPCLFTILPRVRVSNWLAALQSLMNKYARWLERSRPSMLVAGGLFLFALAGLWNIEVDEDFVRYFSPDTQFRQNTEAITARMAGPYHVDVVHDSGETSGIFKQQTIRELIGLVGFLRNHPDVVNVASVIDIFREISLVMGGTPKLHSYGQDELAQYLLTYELSLGVGQSLQDVVDADYRRSRVSVLLNDVSMADMRAFVDSVNAWASGTGIRDRIVVTGEGVPNAYLSSESISEMGWGIVTSVLGSSLLVGLYFRSIWVCLSIFCATIAPILAGFGAWGWVEAEIGMAAILVVAITIGVVIDDTIHLTYRYVDSSRNLDLTPWGATAYSIHKTGTAIVVTSMVLVAGLLVLVGSQFRMNSTFGICASLIILLALVYNMTIAPYFLRRLN